MTRGQTLSKHPPVTTLPLWRKSMRDSRLGLLGWTLGHVGTVLLYLPFYPSIGSNANMQAFAGVPAHPFPANLVGRGGHRR